MHKINIMINNFPPNINPNIFALTSVAIAAALSGDFTATELNAIGNWFELLGQYILTFAAQQQLIESRIDNNNININSKQCKNGGSPFNNGRSNQNQRDDVDYLLRAIKKIENELEKLNRN